MWDNKNQLRYRFIRNNLSIIVTSMELLDLIDLIISILVIWKDRNVKIKRRPEDNI